MKQRIPVVKRTSFYERWALKLCMLNGDQRVRFRPEVICRCRTAQIRRRSIRRKSTTPSWPWWSRPTTIGQQMLEHDKVVGAEILTRSQSYQTLFFVKQRFFCFLLLSLSVCSIIKIICALKWPSLKAKIRKMKKSKFGRIDSKSNLN